MAKRGFEDYWGLYHWSIESSDEFWAALRDFAGLPPAGEPFNFAEQLLHRADGNPAILFRDEAGMRFEWSGNQLKQAVGSYAQLMRQQGIVPGDRVVALLPNLPETLALMLAASAVGAVWSSCSPDFGPEAVRDRLFQIEAKLLFSTRTYRFGGKHYPLQDRLNQLRNELPTLTAVLLIEDLPAPADEPLEFVRMAQDHPLFILYSSGTTGLPKCIVHSAGGTVLQIVKEHLLHVDLHPRDRLFYYTTCGWMMWNWLAVGLASGATLVLYDGSPLYPDPAVLWRLADEEEVAHFGVSARYLTLLEKSGYRPIDHFPLRHLRQILSTGSPLSPQGFDFCDRQIKAGIHVASISGGTDIVSCFVLGNPLLPAHAGEIQCAGLGMDVQIWNEAGERIWDQAGELVCLNRFPSMPLGFWNDADGDAYQAAYFNHFPGVWRHGDWALQRSESRGFIIFGRSDLVLNPGGIRIGASEIYRQVETIPEIADCVAAGQSWNGDVRVILFVRLIEGVVLTPELEQRIRTTLRVQASPHHVPKKILAVNDIPRTMNGKLSEAAVQSAINGRVSGNLCALANPESIKEFQGRLELLMD